MTRRVAMALFLLTLLLSMLVASTLIAKSVYYGFSKYFTIASIYTFVLVLITIVNELSKLKGNELRLI